MLSAETLWRLINDLYYFCSTEVSWTWIPVHARQMPYQWAIFPTSFSFFFSLFILWVWMGRGWAGDYGAHVELEDSSWWLVLSFCHLRLRDATQEGGQPWRQVPSPTETSLWPDPFLFETGACMKHTLVQGCLELEVHLPSPPEQPILQTQHVIF